MAPTFDDALTPGETAWMVGLACRRGGEPDSYQGTLVSSSGGTTVPITLNWLSNLDGKTAACGWLIGSIPAGLAADVWSFNPPAALQPAGNASTVEFSVGASGERRAP